MPDVPMTVDPLGTAWDVPYTAVRAIFECAARGASIEDLYRAAKDASDLPSERVFHLLVGLSTARMLVPGEAHPVRLSEAGRAFLEAGPVSGSSRDRADRLLDGLLARVVHVNDEERLAFRVRRVAVVGSYLVEGNRIGDLEVVVDLIPRGADLPAHRQLVHAARSRGQGESLLGDGTHWDAWPEAEVMSYLRGGEKDLIFHRNWSDVTRHNRHSTVYDLEAGIGPGIGEVDLPDGDERPLAEVDAPPAFDRTSLDDALLDAVTGDGTSDEVFRAALPEFLRRCLITRRGVWRDWAHGRDLVDLLDDRRAAPLYGRILSDLREYEAQSTDRRRLSAIRDVRRSMIGRLVTDEDLLLEEVETWDGRFERGEWALQLDLGALAAAVRLRRDAGEASQAKGFERVIVRALDIVTANMGVDGRRTVYTDMATWLYPDLPERICELATSVPREEDSPDAPAGSIAAVREPYASVLEYHGSWILWRTEYGSWGGAPDTHPDIDRAREQAPERSGR